jgi:hypothetical protein
MQTNAAQSIANRPHDGPFEKIAMIVETRMLDNLVPLLLQFSTVLGPTWQVQLFTMENVWVMPDSAPFRRALRQGAIQVKYLPPDTDLHKWEDVSWFWTRTWIWEQVQSATRVLTFQADSIICSKSTLTVDDFLEWDYIGAPVSPYLGGLGWNGGLSLRNPKLCLEILNGPNNNFQALWDEGHSDAFAEDRFFYLRMSELPHAKLPDPEVAKKFSVETIWYEWPVGYHGPRLWHKDRLADIWKYCPEVELVLPDNRTLEQLAKELGGG